MNDGDATQFETDTGAGGLPEMHPAPVPGTTAHGRRDSSGMELNILVDHHVLVSAEYHALCYDNCRSFGKVAPGTSLSDDERALARSAVDAARHI